MSKNVFFLLFILLFLSSCSDGELSGQSDLVSVSSGKEGFSPPVILTDYSFYIVVGDEAVQITIPAPWMQTRFNFTNKSDYTVTIINVTAYYDQENGKEKVVPINNIDYSSNGILKSPFSVVRSEKDVNCDGIVDDEEKKVENPAPITTPMPDCELDLKNITFESYPVYIGGFLDGLSGEGANIQPYRNRRFPIRIDLVGWFGTPENPEANFFKSIYVTGSSN